MNLFEYPIVGSAWILSETTMERLGWVLLHSLWQFLLIAILALAILRFVKRSAAALRYAILVFTMAVCVVLPVATWFSQPMDTAAAISNDSRKDDIEVMPIESAQLPIGSNDDVATLAEGNGIHAELPTTSSLPTLESSYTVTEPNDWWTRVRNRLRPWLTSIVIAWILGVMICTMRPLLSWIAIRRMRCVGTTPVSQELTEIMLRLSKTLAVRRTVEILLSTLVHVPLVVGYVRPMILLPASLLSNLPTAQLEAIIAHELAHVRRHDFLVNFMQTIIETLFFYHPAIWWLSHRIRIERENCCDDLVIQSLGNRVEYGRALVAVEQLRSESNVLALGVSDGSMLARIRRIAGHSGMRRSSSTWSLVSLLASSLTVVAMIGLVGWHSMAASPALTEIEPESDEPISEELFSDEIKLKLTRKDAHQDKWYFIDLDQGELKTPPFDVDIDATRFPYFVNKPSEEELSDWLKLDGVDLILRSNIYRPDPKGAIERNDIQVRSVRTLLKELPSGLQKEDDGSWAWKARSNEVLDIFGAKDDAVHVVGFIPNATAIDIGPESPFLRSFRTASNRLGLFLLEQPNSNNDELTLRIVHAVNKDRPLDDLRFGPDDFVSGLKSIDQSVLRKSNKAPFMAEFPNDVRVEFIGLSRGAGDVKAADKWWRPDGSPLEQAPTHRGVSGVLKDGEVESENPFVRTVIHVHGIGDTSAVTSTAAVQIAESLQDNSGGQFVTQYGYTEAPRWKQTFEVGVAAEALSPRRWLDRNGKSIESKTEPGKVPPKDLIAEDIIIEKVGPESWGKGVKSKGGMTDPVGPGDQKMGNLSGTTQVTIRFPQSWRKVDLRLFAIDQAGNSHAADFTIALDPNDDNADYIRLAKVIPVDYSEVDHLEYQVRVYRHWAIFENVSLWKGTNSEVVVKTETIPIGAMANTVSESANKNETQPANAVVASDTANKAVSRNDNKPNRVVDAQGKPVAGAKIDCLPSMKYSWLEAPKSLGSTVADGEGWFDYPDGLPSKERFYVYVSADGFLERVFQANNGEAYVLENGIRKPDTLALRRPVTVSGRIVGIDGRPLADADIAVDYMFDNGVAQINGNRVRSDADGRFVAKGVEPANVFVRYETPFKTEEERMPNGTQPGKLCIVSFTATDGQQKDDVVLDLSKCNCIVEGRIMDHEDKGVPNRWIQATIASAKGRLDESITVKSDSEGRFRFEGLTADEFEIGTYTPGRTETVKPSLEKPTQVQLTTYVQGKAALANDPNPPNYGEPSASGIVGGIRLRDGAKPKLGDVVSAEVVIKNSSNRVKMFAYSFAEQANLRAFEGDKTVAELNYSHFTGLTVTMHYRLEPNQEAVVGSFDFGLHDPNDNENGLPKATFQIPCQAGQALTLRCDMSANLFGRAREDSGVSLKDAPLSTGTLSMKVMSTKELAQVVSETDKTLAENSDIEEKVLAILRTPFGYDLAKGTWQGGAHDSEVFWKLSEVSQRTEVIIALFKVVDRSVPSTMDERRLAMQFLSGADPINLVPRLNKEIENAIATPSKPFVPYHEIEMLGRMGEHSRSSLPWLIKLLDSKDSLAYNMAVDALVKIGARSPDVMSELAKHTDDPTTVYQLGRYGPMAKSHGPLFVKLLDSPSNEIRTWGAQALVKTGFDEAKGYQFLITEVASGKTAHRCLAATALAALGSQATLIIPRLRPFENDPDPQVAKAVRDAIVRIEKDDRIFTHAEEATKRVTALEASAAFNPQMQFNLRIVGGEEKIPIAGIEIIATNGYGDSQKKFGPFQTDASGTTLCKLPQGSYTLHLKSKKELPFLPYEKYWRELPPPGLKILYLRVTGIGVEKWLGGEICESGVEPAKSQEELACVTFTLLKPIELTLRAVDIETGRGLSGVYFYLESAVAEDWAHPIDGANLGAARYREGQQAFDSKDYSTDEEGYFKRYISDGYLRRSGDSEWGPKFGVWKSPDGYEVIDPSGEVAIDLPADNQANVERVFRFRRIK